MSHSHAIGPSDNGECRAERASGKKLLTPASRREAVMALCRDYQVSKRRACGLVRISRSSNGYRRRPDRHARLRERLITLSGKHRRYGYRMLHAKLVREGFRVNVKVVERLYREERLALRRRKRKKIPRGVREGAWCPIAANQRWSLDFTMDALANGRKFRTANLKDDCTRECPAIDVALSIPGSRVVAMLGARSWRIRRVKRNWGRCGCNSTAR